MAELVIAAAGAAIGGATLGTGIVAFGMTGTAIGWAAGSMLGSMLVKGPNQQGPRLGDLRVSGTEYGQPIPWVAGSPRIAGQIVWASNKREIATTQKVGKGGGGSKVTTYTYEVDLLILLTENEIAGVSRVWSNGELIWGNGQTKAGVWSELRIYTGAADQMPDPTYEANVGPDNAPAYRGRGYVFIRSLQLGQSGQIPNLTFEVGAALEKNFSDVVLLTNFQSLTINDGFVDESIYSHEITSIRQINGEKYTINSDGLYIFNSGSGDQPWFAFFGSQLWADPWWDSIYPGTGDYTIEVQFNLMGGDFGSGINAVVFDESIFEIKLLVVGGSVPTISFRNEDANERFSLQLANSFAHLLNGLVNVVITRVSGVVYFSINGEILHSYNSSKNISLNSSSPSPRGFRIGWGRFSPTISTKNFTISAFRYSKTKIYDPTSDVLNFAKPLSNFLYLSSFGSQQALPLNDVANNLMLRSGYDNADFDIGGLNDEEKPVRALAIGQTSNTRSTLEMLQKAWYYEASKSDRIYIRPRAVTPVATIPWADLGVGDDIENEQEPLALQIGSDLEIPAQVALSYNNMAGDYNIATEHSDRLISGQESTAAIQMPLGMLPAEAKGVADALLFDQVASLTSTTIRLPLKYAYLEPGDVIEAINYDGRNYRLRIQSKRDTLSILEMECVLDDVGALQSAAITDGGYITITEPVRVAPTLFEALDIPILRDADSEPGYYAAVAADRDSEDDEWDGAVFVQAFSPGAFTQEFITGESCVMGECLTTLGNWTGGNVFDETNTLNVEVVGELESSTRDLMLADLSINAMLIGSELIRFRLATLLSSDGAKHTYRLSGLLRGQRGTEWAMSGHVASERCVLLTNALRRVPGLLTQIGLERDVKAVTLNTLLSDVPDLAFTNEAVGLKPFSPANVVALADGADLRITWQRRTRLAVKYGGAVDQVVPLGEVSEQYRVRIFDGPTLVHTATVTEPEYLYTDLTADGFTSGDPVTVEVSQLSAIVGAGYPTTTTGIAP